jgi:ferredoxin
MVCHEACPYALRQSWCHHCKHCVDAHKLDKMLHTYQLVYFFAVLVARGALPSLLASPTIFAPYSTAGLAARTACFAAGAITLRALRRALPRLLPTFV